MVQKVVAGLKQSEPSHADRLLVTIKKVSIVGKQDTHRASNSENCKSIAICAVQYARPVMPCPALHGLKTPEAA